MRWGFTWRACLLLCAAAICAFAGNPALGQKSGELRLAFSAPATSVDPHFQNATPNFAIARNFFDTLVQMDPDNRIVPGLAESWRRLDDTTWEFKLRRARFHDGAELTAEDVAWSLDRPATIENSPAPYTIYTKSIVGKRVVDARTIQLTTSGPYPLLLADLSQVIILNKKAAENLDRAQFLAALNRLGTGPYRFVSYAPEDRVTMERFDDHWGGRPAWDKVLVRFITNEAARISALLAGDVDAIENVPTQDVERIKNDTSLVLAAKKSNRVVFLFLDSGRDQSPTVSDLNGKPLASNPLKDLRVRKAINLAIDRNAIRDRIMTGIAYPTNNLATEAMPGFDPALEAVPFDPAQARKLLADAGYPDGFRLTIASPNNRLINDAKVAQAVAQMLTRVGIRTQVDAMPFAVIATRGNKGEFSSSMMAWGVQTAEASSPIRMMLACPDKAKGWGAVNWGNYCNRELDGLLTRVVSTMDDDQRNGLLKQLVRQVMDDVALVPLYFQGSTWAAKKGIAITPRGDERTTASMFAPEK
jgi:peptide/nickel transport system substrate-binding protein